MEGREGEEGKQVGEEKCMVLEDVRSEPLVPDTHDEEEEEDQHHAKTVFFVHERPKKEEREGEEGKGEEKSEGKTDPLEEVKPHSSPLPTPLPLPSPPPSPPLSSFPGQKITYRRQYQQPSPQKLGEEKNEKNSKFALNVCFVKELLVVAACLSAIFLVVSMFVLASNPKWEPPELPAQEQP